MLGTWIIVYLLLFPSEVKFWIVGLWYGLSTQLLPLYTVLVIIFVFCFVFLMLLFDCGVPAAQSLIFCVVFCCPSFILFSSPSQRPCELLPSGFVHRRRLSLAFHILIFSSETTEPIWTKLCWNGPWMAPFQKCVRWSRLPTKMAAKLKIEKGGGVKF